MIEVVETPLVIFEKGIYRPEPTRFWILDRKVRGEISKLEAEGWIRRFSEKITAEKELFRFFTELHEREVRRREEILRERFPEVYRGSGRWDKVCREVLLNPEVGIGGIRKFRSRPFKVRCLHLWTAYHLGEEEFRNPIGEFVLRRLLTSP